MGPHFVKSSNTKTGCIQPPQLRNSWDFFDIKQQTSPKSPSFTIHLQPFPISQSLCLNSSFYLQVRPLHPHPASPTRDPLIPSLRLCACPLGSILAVGRRLLGMPSLMAGATPAMPKDSGPSKGGGPWPENNDRLRKSTKSWYVLVCTSKK